MTKKEFNFHSPETGIGFYYGPVKIMKKSHRHPSLEFNILESGSMTYSFNEKNLTLNAHELFVFNGMYSHHVRQTDSNPLMFWLTVPLSLVSTWSLPPTIWSSLINGDLIVNKDSTFYTYDHSLFKRWKMDLDSEGYSSMRLILLEILVRLERLAISCKKEIIQNLSLPSLLNKNVPSQKLDQMITYILHHFRDPITVQEVAEHCQISPQYAIRIFKKVMGKSPAKFIKEQRLDYATMLLLSTERKVLDIAYDSGFQNASRFYEAFQKHSSLPPGKFRNKNNLNHMNLSQNPETAV